MFPHNATTFRDVVWGLAGRWVRGPWRGICGPLPLLLLSLSQIPLGIFCVRRSRVARVLLGKT